MDKTLKRWASRPPEEAFLFNPAFVGSLLYEFVKEYSRSKPVGTPLSFLPVALAVILHKKTRERLPHSTVSSLYEWMQNNEDVLIGFNERVLGLRPFHQEALLFSLSHKSLRFGTGHLLVCGSLKVHFSASFKRDSTQEIVSTIDRIKFLARWFAKSGSEASILACWGVRP